MKRVLVLGENSYIGKAFRQYGESRFETAAVSVSDGSWRGVDFRNYDAAIYLAALVHKKEKKEMAVEYDRINCHLAAEIAQRAKADGIKHFVFVSTAAVYDSRVGEIKRETPEQPGTLYGRSKLKAEKQLREMETEAFRVAVIRPPMVYGKECPGNFFRLVKLAEKLPVFPAYHNQRSMIYIENLCEFFCLLIEKEKGGLFYPQNKEYVDTCELVRQICDFYGKKTVFTSIFNGFIKWVISWNNTAYKIFGDYCYSKEISQTDGLNYNVEEQEASVWKSLS